MEVEVTGEVVVVLEDPRKHPHKKDMHRSPYKTLPLLCYPLPTSEAGGGHAEGNQRLRWGGKWGEEG